MHGRTLVPLIEGQVPTDETEAFIAAVGECLIDEKNWLYGLRNKYVYSPHQHGYEELYDLLHDPTERINIAKKHPDISKIFRTKVEAMLSSQVTVNMEAREKERLEATLKTLGYL